MALNTNKILPPSPREPFVNSQGIISPRWQLWLEQLQRMLGNITGIDWTLIDKSNASLADLNSRLHSDLQSVLGISTAGAIDEDAEVLHLSRNQVAQITGEQASSNAEILHWFY